MDRNIIIDAISDTHNQHEKINLPGGDLLICSGDISGHGETNEVLRFLDWYAEQDYSSLVLVPGNHDFIFENNPGWCQQECAERDIILLNDTGCELRGIKIWGSPIQPYFFNWAFNRHRGSEIKRHWDMIPEDTEILITHGPPHMILDHCQNGNVGCKDLYDRIVQTKIKLHVFGHIHEGSGFKYLHGRTYVNAASLDGRYKFSKPGYKRIIKEGNDYLVET